MTRAAIYLRLSQDRDESTSIERQRRDCLRLAEQRGWKVVVEEVDEDVSASKRRLQRPGLQRLRDRYGELDALIFWRVDRLARSVVDFGNLMAEAEEAGVALVSATEPVDLSTPMGRAMAQIIAIFAELESKTLGLRVASAVRHLRETGRATGGQLPYWLTRVPRDGGGYVEALHPERAEVVREVVERALRKEPLIAIARDLTARGVPTSQGKARWSGTSLRTLLGNEAMLGRTIHHGEVMRGSDGLPLAHRPALVDRATWDRLQEELERRANPRERRQDGRGLLSGIATCGECGEPLYLRVNEVKGKKRPQYGCSGRVHKGPETCPGVLVSRPLLESYVEETFLGNFGRFPVLRPVVTPAEDHTAELEAVREAMRELETDRYERGLFRGADGARRFTEMYQRLEAKEAALAALPVTAGGVDWEETGESFAQAWEQRDVHGRRELLASALEAVLVRKGQRGKRFDGAERVALLYRS